MSLHGVVMKEKTSLEVYVVHVLTEREHLRQTGQPTRCLDKKRRVESNEQK